MNFLGVFEIPITIRGRNFVHPETVVKDINDNIIGINFMHINKINYDALSKEITFAHMLRNALYAVKETTIPALSSMIISTKFKGKVWDTAKQSQLFMLGKIQQSQVCQLLSQSKIGKWSLTIVRPMTLSEPEMKFWVYWSSNQKSASQ
jgi:hypothetical protein